VKLTQTCKERFLEALAETGSVSTAVAIAGTSRTRVYDLRKTDPAFASAWQDAEEIATDRLEDEAKRRAEYQNRSSAQARWYATIMVNPSWFPVTRIPYYWRATTPSGIGAPPIT